MRMFPLALLIGLAGCAGTALPPSAALPPGYVSGGTDPFRYAVLTSAYTFNAPGEASAPAKARGAMLVEYLAANQPWEPRWAEFAPPTGQALAAARGELREALDIPAEAPAHLVVLGLSFAERRLNGEADVPPLPAAAFPRPDNTLQRLASLPTLPSTRGATAMAERELLRIDQARLNQQTGPGSGLGRH